MDTSFEMEAKYWNDRNERNTQKAKAEDEMLQQLAGYYDCIIDEFMMLPHINSCIEAGKLDMNIDNKRIINNRLVEPDITLLPSFQPIIKARKTAL